jgi:phosphatidylglycerophosphate synthase
MLLLLGFLVIHFVTMNMQTEPTIIPAKIGKLATVLQLLMVIFILIAPDISRIFGHWIWFLRILWWSAAITAILATFIYICKGSRYIEAYEEKESSKS